MGKVTDLNKNRTTLTEADLARAQQVAGSINKAQFDLGTIELQKHEILHAVHNLNTQMQTLRKEFVETYGTDDINIQDGTINREDAE